MSVKRVIISAGLIALSIVTFLFFQNETIYTQKYFREVLENEIVCSGAIECLDKNIDGIQARISDENEKAIGAHWVKLTEKMQNLGRQIAGIGISDYSKCKVYDFSNKTQPEDVSLFVEFLGKTKNLTNSCNKIIFPKRNIRLENTILIRKSTQLIGQKGYWIYYQGNESAIDIKTEGDVEIRDVSIVGLSELMDKYKYLSSRVEGISISEAHSVIIDSVKLRKFKLGIFANGTIGKFLKNIVIKNSSFALLGTSALRLSYVDGAVIDSNLLQDVWGTDPVEGKFADGIYLFGSKNILIYGNEFNRLRRIGVVLESDEEFKRNVDFSSRLVENVAILKNKFFNTYGSRGSEYNAGVWAELGKYLPHSVLISGNVFYNSDSTVLDSSPHPVYGVYGSGLFLYENKFSREDTAVEGGSLILFRNTFFKNLGKTEYGFLPGTVIIRDQLSDEVNWTRVKDDKESIYCSQLVNCPESVERAFLLSNQTILSSNIFKYNSLPSVLADAIDGQLIIQKNYFKSDEVKAVENRFDLAEIVLFKVYSAGLVYKINDNGFVGQKEFPAISLVSRFIPEKRCRNTIRSNVFDEQNPNPIHYRKFESEITEENDGNLGQFQKKKNTLVMGKNKEVTYKRGWLQSKKSEKDNREEKNMYIDKVVVLGITREEAYCK